MNPILQTIALTSVERWALQVRGTMRYPKASLIGTYVKRFGWQGRPRKLTDAQRRANAAQLAKEYRARLIAKGLTSKGQPRSPHWGKLKLMSPEERKAHIKKQHDKAQKKRRENSRGSP